MSYFDDASLVMIPSGYKTSKVYSVKPTDGSGDLTFSRSNDTATRVNSAGLIEKVRTNLITYSNDLSNAAWAKLTNGTYTITSETITDPFGNSVAVQKVTLTSGTFLVFRNTLGAATTTATTGSVYIKKTVSTTAVDADLSDVGSAVSASNTNWQRLVTTNPSGGSFLDVTISTPNQPVYVAYAQIEVSDFGATDYIATTSAAVSVGPVANVPRLDYLNSSCPRLLLEPQRTNLFTYSEQLNTGTSGATATPNQAVSPDGYTNADLITGAGANNYIAKSISGAFTGTHTFSIFLKAGTDSAVGLDIYDGTYYNATYNLAAGVASGTGASMVSYGNGWYRCILTRTTSANPVEVSVSSIGDGLTIYAWGGQFEANASYATSYIPTLGAAVTRGVDFGSSSDTIGTSYSSSDFSYFIEFDLLQDSGTSNSPMLFGGGNSALGASYQGYFRLGLSGNNSMILFGHGDSQMASVIYPFTKGTRYKLLVKRSGTSIKFYVNGAQVGATGTSSLDFTLRSIGWSYAAGSYNTYGNIYQFLAFQTALSDADAIALTA